MLVLILHGFLHALSLTLEFPPKHSVFPQASVYGFQLFFFPYFSPLFFFLFSLKSSTPILLFSLFCSAFMCTPHILHHLIYFQFFFTGCSLHLSPFKPYSALYLHVFLLHCLIFYSFLCLSFRFVLKLAQLFSTIHFEDLQALSFHSLPSKSFLSSSFSWILTKRSL